MNELLALAVELAADGAALASRMRAAGLEVGSKSTPVDVVTSADRAVEADIRGRLARRRPGDGFLGEESAAAETSTGLTWIVDPIDGTVNFLYGIPRWACSVAVARGSDPATWTMLAGAVVNPVLGEHYAAALGEGATLNGSPISASTVVDLSMSLVGTGFAYRADLRAEQGRAVQAMLPRVRDIRRVGAASLDLCDTATGRLDAYAERGLMPWDFAAGALIASEAGAVVSADDLRPDRDGDRRLVVAAAPAIAADFTRLVADIGL